MISPKTKDRGQAEREMKRMVRSVDGDTPIKTACDYAKYRRTERQIVEVLKKPINMQTWNEFKRKVRDQLNEEFRLEF